jgi:hypothetical protein
MTFHAAQYDGNLGYVATDDRQPMEMSVNGQGITEPGAFVCAAGSGMNTTMSPGRGNVRNSFAAVQGGLWSVRNDGTVSVTHSNPDTVNPRLDTVGVRVYDSESGGDSSDITQPLIVPGTPTSGTTLVNRSGATAWPNNFMPCFDVLVPANAASAASFSYADRRPIGVNGIVGFGAATTNVDAVVPLPGPGIMALPWFNNGLFTFGPASFITAAAIYIPRRVQANYVQSSFYRTGTGSGATNVMFGIYDASGYPLMQCTSSIPNTAGAQNLIVPWTSPRYLDAGLYYAAFANQASGSGAAIQSQQCWAPTGGNAGVSRSSLPGVAFFDAAYGFGGTLMSGLSDAYATTTQFATPCFSIH